MSEDVEKAYLYEFDKFDTIKYKDISTLFFGRYPYKISVWAPARSGPGHAISKDREKNDSHYKKMRSQIYCPFDQWHSQRNTQTFSFFFMEKIHALNFIRDNHAHILTAWRPRNSKEVEVLLSDPKLEIRDMLYWDRFKYAIDFTDNSDNDFIDEEIHRLFPKKRKNSASIRYIMNKKRRLLLNSDVDLLYVYMALSNKITKRTEAILRKNIK